MSAPVPVILDAQAGRKALIELRPAYSPVSAAQRTAIAAFLADCVANNVIADVVLWPDPVVTPLAQSDYAAMIAYYGPTVRQYYPLVYAGTISTTPGGDLATFQAYYPGPAAVDRITASYYVGAYAAGLRLEPVAAIADNGGLEFGLHAAGVARSDDPTDAAAYMQYLAVFFAARFNAGLGGDVLWDQESPYDIEPGSYLVPLYGQLFDAVTLGVTPVPPLPPPPPPPIPPPTTRVDWSWVLGPIQPIGGHTTGLTNAQSRSLKVRVGPSETSEASFDINGMDPAAAAVQELLTDLQVYRGGQILFAGRIVPTQDNLDANSHQVSVTARDYREVLRKRLCPAATYTATDVSLIAWNLIASTQGDDGGDLGIARGGGQSAQVTQTVTYTEQDFVSDKIDELAGSSPGLGDWDITAYGTADLRFDTWPSGRGTDRGVVLEWGSTLITQITRSPDPTTYANALHVTGAQGTTPVDVVVPDIATRAEGRWESTAGTDIRTQSALTARAAWLLAQAQVLVPSYTVTMTRGGWDGPAHIWAGDYVWLRISSGRLNVNSRYRVQEIDIDIDSNGQEIVQLQVGQIPLDPRRLIPKMLTRIRTLESR